MKKKLKRSPLIIMLFFVFLISCGGEMEQKSVTYSSLKDIPDAAWEKLSKKKIYFGHQSVGFNIIDGVKDLMKEYPKIKLNIVETSDSKDFSSGVFAHSTIGTNTNPKSKIDEFASFIDKGIGAKADTAAMKLCYIDIRDDTNIVDIFNRYKTETDEIKQKYPSLTIVHFTAPLVKRQTGIKAWIKKIIGKPISGIDDNIKRNEFNDLLRNEYQGKSPVFDIATLESTHLDGIRSTFEKNGTTYYAMAPEYTYDDGHLNQQGGMIVAENLLIMLAEL